MFGDFAWLYSYFSSLRNSLKVVLNGGAEEGLVLQKPYKTLIQENGSSLVKSTIEYLRYYGLEQCSSKYFNILVFTDHGNGI